MAIEHTDLRLRLLKEDVDRLKEEAWYAGKSLGEYIRPKLREIIDKYPDKMKKEPPLFETKGIRLSGVSSELVAEIENVAKHLGLKPSQLIRIAVRGISDDV